MRSVAGDARLRFYDEAALEALRAAWHSGDRLAGAAVRRVLERARAALQGRVPTVLDKTGVAPSENRHDYWRLAPYWWPDPAKPDGLPFIRRDGEHYPPAQPGKPEGSAYDQSARQRFVDGLTALGLAWYFTREMRYARRAAAFARAWMVTPRTRMNPHLRFAQVRRGHGDEGNGPGIIDFRELPRALDALRLAIRSGALRKAQAKTARAWLGQLLRWLRTSRQGREAAAHRNNIGTCYDLVVMSVALFVGAERIARQHLARALHRMAGQLGPDGSQPAEERRTRPLHYAVYNLELWTDLACVARTLEMDVWSVEASGGRGLPRALGLVTRRIERGERLSTRERARLRARVRALARQAAGSGAGARLRVWGL